jgi:hypothetical protein
MSFLLSGISHDQWKVPRIDEDGGAAPANAVSMRQFNCRIGCPARQSENIWP